jgi:hypothetical protein
MGGVLIFKRHTKKWNKELGIKAEHKRSCMNRISKLRS